MIKVAKCRRCDGRVWRAMGEFRQFNGNQVTLIQCVKCLVERWSRAKRALEAGEEAIQKGDQVLVKN